MTHISLKSLIAAVAIALSVAACSTQGGFSSQTDLTQRTDAAAIGGGRLNDVRPSGPRGTSLEIPALAADAAPVSPATPPRPAPLRLASLISTD